MKTKFNIGNNIKIRIGDIPGFITDIKYEVVWADKEGSPCKSTFSQMELCGYTNSELMGFKK